MESTPEEQTFERRLAGNHESHPGAPHARLMALDQVIRWLCQRPPTADELITLRTLADGRERQLHVTHQEASK